MDDKTTATARPLGRPRDERADRTILTAAIELIAAHGVRDLRMDDVADRAGVGKATIYRRYRSKDDLVTAAVYALVSEITIPDTGSTRADLAALMHSAVQVYSGSVEAGGVARPVDGTNPGIELALDVLAGPLFYRLLITGGPIDRKLADGVVELILRGFAPESHNPKREVAP